MISVSEGQHENSDSAKRVELGKTLEIIPHMQAHARYALQVPTDHLK